MTKFIRNILENVISPLMTDAIENQYYRAGYSVLHEAVRIDIMKVSFSEYEISIEEIYALNEDL